MQRPALSQDRTVQRIGTAQMPRPTSDAWTFRLLLIALSITAGSTDTIGFLDLNGLFTAHITGNLVVLAAHIVDGSHAQLAQLLAVPVFVAVLGVTILFADGLKASQRDPLCPLLFLQFVLLICLLLLCTAAEGIGTSTGVIAGMVGVSAMAVQNVLVQLCLKGAPATAVMTSNIVRFSTDVGEVLLGRNSGDVAAARIRAAVTLPVIMGFATGCAVGAAAEMAVGVRSLAVPAFFALFALAFAAAEKRRRAAV